MSRLPNFWRLGYHCQKKGFETFLQLWSLNFMQKINELWWAVLDVQTGGWTDRRTNGHTDNPYFIGSVLAKPGIQKHFNVTFAFFEFLVLIFIMGRPEHNFSWCHDTATFKDGLTPNSMPLTWNLKQSFKHSWKFSDTEWSLSIVGSLL